MSIRLQFWFLLDASRNSKSYNRYQYFDGLGVESLWNLIGVLFARRFHFIDKLVGAGEERRNIEDGTDTAREGEITWIGGRERERKTSKVGG